MIRSSIKRYFETRHSTFESKYPAGESKKRARQKLLSRVQAGQQQLRVWTQQGDGNWTGFAGAFQIMTNRKLFTDGEDVKHSCLMSPMNCLTSQPIVKTWNTLPVTYHTLQRVSIDVLAMFGYTYVCEQSFSNLQNIQTNL
ncbi:general transcription factor ii-i repeat domain-containing 2-like protein [Plakobranchus ocellatus]|uniref:General transcription factor ii-i repeat domain-containing 2-like protein n=1 Tax=Plakobranchus ocellatus TaxID=259542 RepID=A0AAV3Y096_9GAST|nr:general transcription factor ii-i repeat domain-containing 2-like protein [Plakobranchus ocellatus]